MARIRKASYTSTLKASGSGICTFFLILMPQLPLSPPCATTASGYIVRTSSPLLQWGSLAFVSCLIECAVIQRWNSPPDPEWSEFRGPHYH